MYVGTADLRYLSRFDVNRGLPPPYSQPGGLGDIKPETFKVPIVPYRELSSAPLSLIRRQARMQRRQPPMATPTYRQSLSGLGDLEGFFSTSKKWRRRYAAVMADVGILKWWGYKFTPEDEKHIRMVAYKAAKEKAERSGLSRVMQDVAIPAALTVMSAGTLTPVAVGMAAGAGVLNAAYVRKAENQMLDAADKAFVINEDIIQTEYEVKEIQKEIADLQKKSGVPKEVINKGVQDAANKQAAEKKALTGLLLGGGALAVAAMAA